MVEYIASFENRLPLREAEVESEKVFPERVCKSLTYIKYNRYGIRLLKELLKKERVINIDLAYRSYATLKISLSKHNFWRVNVCARIYGCMWRGKEKQAHIGVWDLWNTICDIQYGEWYYCFDKIFKPKQNDFFISIMVDTLKIHLEEFNKIII